MTNHNFPAGMYVFSGPEGLFYADSIEAGEQIMQLMPSSVAEDWTATLIPYPIEPNTPIDQLIAEYEAENCDFGNLDWLVRASYRYMDTMQDSQVRCLLYALAKWAEKSLPIDLLADESLDPDIDQLTTKNLEGLLEPPFMRGKYRKTYQAHVEDSVVPRKPGEK